MDTTVTCPDCQTHWVVVTGTQKAHPGHAEKGIWKPARPSANLAVIHMADQTIYSWACLCGHTLAHSTERLELVVCQYQAGESGMCAVAHTRQNPPADLYVNRRYGHSCPCCGRQGSHWVRADRQGGLPSCLTQSADQEPVTS